MVVKFFDFRGKKVLYKFHRPKFLQAEDLGIQLYQALLASLILLFKGGITDGIICASPDTWKGKDLLRIPHELYQPCPFPSPDLESSEAQQPGSAHWAVPRPPESHSAECELKPKPRPANLRHAMATVIITGIVCGIVCLMMLAAAIYGCTYAAITAKYHGGPLAQTNKPATTEGKELFDISPA